MLRRAWGVYFALWSVALLLLLAVEDLGLSLPFSPDRDFGLALGDLGIVLGAGLLTLRHFRGAWTMTHFPLWRVGMGFVISFLLLVGSLLVASFLPVALALAGLSLAMVVVSVILWKQIAWSIGLVPSEGRWAVIALVIGAVGSWAAYAWTGNIQDDGAFWLLTVLAWGLCAAWALSRRWPEIPPRPGEART